MRLHHFAGIFCACLLLAACGSDKNTTPRPTTGDESLPKPEPAVGIVGAVTGMPNPGTPSSPPAPVARDPSIAVDLGSDEPVVIPPGMSTDASAAASVAADAAVRVLREYYAAINARDYDQAYSQWGDGGRASGQSSQKFADGYAETVGVSVVLGEPGPVEGAAGSRYVEIPATLVATQSDGSSRQYAGAFTLRMTVVDGASEAQRHWHIASASLHEVRQ